MENNDISINETDVISQPGLRKPINPITSTSSAESTVQPGLEDYVPSISPEEILAEYNQTKEDTANAETDVEADYTNIGIEDDLDEEDLLNEDTEDDQKEEIFEEDYNSESISESDQTIINELDNEDDMVDFEVEKSIVKSEENDSVLDENEIEAQETSDEDNSIEVLKAMITEKIKPINTKLDLSSFTVASKGTNNNNIFDCDVAATKWVLPTTGITILMKELKGSELERLRMLMQSNNARGTLQMIYDNIVSPKPSFNKWINSIAFEDYDHLFMAIYVASFGETNYMPIDCTNDKCTKKSYITDHVPFKDLINYKDDKAKQLFMDLYREEPVEAKGFKATEIIPIAEKWAVGFTTPSLYSIMIESGYFDNNFREKYASAISIAPYIDKFYLIDYDNKSLVPIEYTTYDNNDAKTAKSKIVKYNKILSTLSSDEISVIRAYTESINESGELITYKQPETTCPHCGHVNPEITEGNTAATMLFLRNQLALLVNTTTTKN